MQQRLSGKRETYIGNIAPVSANETVADNLPAAARQKDDSFSIAESGMCYVVTIRVPAEKKENIVVYAVDHRATVVVFKENNIEDWDEDISSDDLSIVFRQKISLPLDADADFMHAVFHNGVLRLYVSKCKRPCDVVFHPVAVY
ncbi:Hsp20/alpha crystallin family protein [Chitinophagaceae bacterium 26-R-25]|nr:Hsp20/alpha crystallin family protein [Chitinophagaceae bacterium 26-R-25]